ncbi:TIGR04540 family protein [Heliorestis acidaminivorans]|uniref:TIGR04540 family protein n=1 Tax=Heliorestis acidaminivorans TaxID=553427 RepID=A0A6I0EX86_9FIRM|nr:TIGR04540 family protein [Heliorestis acidaminivorans]KAB2950889.1 TIGR04540 family protein [Heliorestis acidaminivorans]
MSRKEYIIFHKNVVHLAQEINKAFNDYWNRELTEIELKELLWKWASTGKLFKGDDYSKSLKRIVGKERLKIMDKLLEGYQKKI